MQQQKSRSALDMLWQLFSPHALNASTKMDTGLDIEITRHAVQDKSLTPGITLDYMKHEEHQGHPAAALNLST